MELCLYVVQQHIYVAQAIEIPGQGFGFSMIPRFILHKIRNLNPQFTCIGVSSPKVR